MKQDEYVKSGLRIEHTSQKQTISTFVSPALSFLFFLSVPAFTWCWLELMAAINFRDRREESETKVTYNLNR